MAGFCRDGHKSVIQLKSGPAIAGQTGPVPTALLIVFNGYYPYHLHAFSGSPLDAVASV